MGAFLQYVGAHASDATLKSSANTAYTSYQATIAQNYSGSAEGGTGLSIYLPAQGSSIRSDYTAANFSFVNDTQWLAFLTAYVNNAAPLTFRVSSSTPAAGSAVATAPVDYTVSLNYPYAAGSVQATDLTVNSVPADSVTLVDASTLRFHYNTAPMSAPGNYIMAIAAGAITRQSNGSAITAWSASFRYGVPHIGLSPSSLAASVIVGGSTGVPLDVSNTGNWDLTWSTATNLGAYVSTDSDHTGGPTYSWIDISSGGSAITGLGDDANTGTYNIGFTFPFYGNNFTTFRVCSNGFLSFSSTSTSYSNTGLPSTSAPVNLVAFAWDDLNFTNSGTAYYKQTDASTLVVEFLNVPYYSDSTKHVTAEAILKSDGTMKFQYRTLDIANSMTVGIQDATGANGLQVAYNSTYLHTNLAVQISKTASWLSLTPSSGTTSAGGVTHCTAAFNSTGLAAGAYTANLTINTNDPSQSVVQVPVTFTVSTLLPLTVNIVPSSIAEGAGVLTGQATVSVPTAVASPLTVTLQSSRTNELTAPTTVVIAAGSSSAPFDLTVLHDGILDGPQSVTVTASASGYLSGGDSIVVNDIDTAVLSLVLPASALETAGVLPGAGWLNITPTPVSSFVVSLASSDTSRLAVPATVTIPPNQNYATFDLTPLDNHLIDAGAAVTVTAHYAGWTDGTGSIQVQDADGTMSLSLPASLYENAGLQAGAGTVTLGGKLANDLAVTLTSSDTGSLVAPVSVTVPAGQLSASFDLTPVDNSICDGIRNVTVTASATGFSSAYKVVAIADDDVNHFDFNTIATQYGSTSFTTTITAKDVNGVAITNYSGTVALSASGGHGEEPITIGARDASAGDGHPVEPQADNPPKALGLYHTYASLTNDLNAYAAAFPSICQLYNIGTSVQGRNLWAVKITQNPAIETDKPEFFYGSTMHGNEPVGEEMSVYLVDYLLNNYGTDPRITALVNSTEIWIVPLINPDGNAAGTRENADGVDLNRSFPEGGPPNNIGNVFSGPAINTTGLEPETAALMRFYAAHRFVAAANFHTGSLVVNYPYDNNNLGNVNSPTSDDALFQYLALTYSSHNAPMYNSTTFSHGITNGAAWYVVDGGMQDWCYRYTGDDAVTIELSNTFQPPASQLPSLWNDNRESMLSFMESVDKLGIDGVVTDAVTGLPLSAQITVQGNNQPAFTDADVGDFHRMLLPGTYTITVSAPGYNSRTIPSVTVASCCPTREDVALIPLSAGVALSGGTWSGTVRVNALDTNVRLAASDGQGHSGQSNAFTVTYGPLDHFAWSAVSSPQIVNRPFATTVTAQDANNYTVASYTGTAALSGLGTGTTSTGTIGTGTSTWSFPLYTYYHDSRTQVIYLASELSGAHTITALALNVSTLPGQTLNYWTIRMKHTSLASYTTASMDGASSGWTTVYQANQTISTTGWVTFSFTTTFAYDGTDNLMIDFSHNNSSYTSYGAVYSTTMTTTRSAYAYSDSGYGDPLSWSGTISPSVYGSTSIPNVRLTYQTVPISPATTGNFTAGVWLGNITVTHTETGMQLSGSSSGFSGLSNSFDVADAPDLAIAKSHAASFRQGDSGDTYAITVTNGGSRPTSGTVTVTDTLPAGLAPTAADGGTIHGWNVSYSGQTVTATRSDALAAGASYPALTVTVNVAGSAPTSVTNVATVSGGSEVNSANDMASDPTTIVSCASIAGRYIFYNNSSFDGNNSAANAQDDAAIASDKAPLLPGGTARFANYTSYSLGINGIIIDVANMAQVPVASDFTFQVGNGSVWTTAPAPNCLIVRPGPGGASRIDINWPDGAIAEQWLKVVVPHSVVGLQADDVFYWGNAIGDTGNSTADTYVNATDEILTRHNSTSSAGITNVEDFNRDGRVDINDVNIVRQNGTNFASAPQLITAPNPRVASAQSCWWPAIRRWIPTAGY